MIALLDVNVLIALFDGAHVHHEIAHAWFGRQRARGWATCPLTENALARILSHPSYAGRGTTTSDAIERLETLRSAGKHSFWPDDVSLCDASIFRAEGIGGHGHITDVYLLALAVKNHGTLATFDRGIPLGSVVGATTANLMSLH
ncbi:MAG: TA system VapC family ribonuclease toxin [Acidobacteriota bacterium]